jgi:hypothetical protein
MKDYLRSLLTIPHSSDIDDLCVPANKVQEFVERAEDLSFQTSRSFHHSKEVGYRESYIKHARRHLNPIHLISFPALIYVRDTFFLVCSSCQFAAIRIS